MSALPRSLPLPAIARDSAIDLYLAAAGAPTESVADVLARAAEAEQLLAEQRERIAELEAQLMTDELTGLLNRRGFRNHFGRALASAQRDADATGILALCDLDGFKAINDTYGHHTGDLYLKAVAHELTTLVRPQDVVARIGGDEFAVLLTRIDPATGAERMVDLARALNRARCELPGHDGPRSLPLRASFGFRPYGTDDDEDEAMREADGRMYAAKLRRRSRRISAMEPRAVLGGR